MRSSTLLFSALGVSGGLVVKKGSGSALGQGDAASSADLLLIFLLR